MKTMFFQSRKKVQHRKNKSEKAGTKKEILIFWRENSCSRMLKNWRKKIWNIAFFRIMNVPESLNIFLQCSFFYQSLKWSQKPNCFHSLLFNLSLWTFFALVSCGYPLLLSLKTFLLALFSDTFCSRGKKWRSNTSEKVEIIN